MIIIETTKSTITYSVKNMATIDNIWKNHFHKLPQNEYTKILAFYLSTPFSLTVYNNLRNLKKRSRHNNTFSGTCHSKYQACTKYIKLRRNNIVYNRQDYFFGRKGYII